ncbi:hypothetical protein TKK_0010140 [Trichogramma kaykai]
MNQGERVNESQSEIDNESGNGIHTDPTILLYNSRPVMENKAVQTDPMLHEPTPVGGYITEEVFIMESAMKKISKIEVMIKKSGSKETERDQEESLLPEFPLKSLEDVDDFNNVLHHLQGVQYQFKVYVQSVGGKTMGEVIRNALREVIDDSLLLSSFTWTGFSKESPNVKKRVF